jgi:hypothetical protein
VFVAVRVLGSPARAPRVVLVHLADADDGQAVFLPPGHPPIDACPQAAPGFPGDVDDRLPPGHPPVGIDRLPVGHPPVDGPSRFVPILPQDGTSTI